ncbi:hypothetical protein [Thiolapillus sp.]|uniref:hypothetical protein n=1 Tax=Thiolapillus sp. TaxID=2017437 RepID=UPI003AF996A3
MRTTGKQCGLAATGVYQPSLRSPWLAASAFASCPFGTDCKPPPYEAKPEAPAGASAGGAYAPRFQPGYGAVNSAPYQPSNQAGNVYSAHVYGLPPCDPNAKPPETKPVVPVIPEEKPPGNYSPLSA